MPKEPYTMNFPVHYYEVDRFERSSPMAILDYLQEVATLHAYELGFGFDHILKENKAWVLNRWSLQMERYPRFRDEISIQTWPSSLEKVTGTREFRILDAQKIQIGCATSRWAYIDLAKRRPTRAPVKDEYMAYRDPTRVLDDPFGEIPLPVTAGHQSDVTVHRFDLDSLEHVNNVRYVQWMLEGVPADLLDNCELATLEIIYRKEIGLDDVVHVHTEPLLNGSCLHRISDREHADVTLARTTWRRRH